MCGRSDSGRPKRRLIDAEAKARFLAVVRAGKARDAAAAEAGFPLKSLYGARRRDPVFRLAWTWAMELSAADERAPPAAFACAVGGGPDDAPVLIAPNGGRLLQCRRMRHVRFDAARQKVFLDHFAGTADACAAAKAAGVHYSTVFKHRRCDPQFAAAFDEALHMAYGRLEPELLRQRLAAQARLSEGRVPEGEVERDFDRAMKLLARWDRRGGGIGPRTVGHGRLQRWSFDKAILLLKRRLLALGVPIPVLPDEGEAPPPDAAPAPPDERPRRSARR